MVATVATVAYLGLEARAVEVQVQLTSGVPKFTIVGLADKAVAESRERVRAALSSIGLALPPKVITVNLSPADLPKEGSHYDLPIALGLLAAIGATDAEGLSHYVVVGELCLDGRITASPGVLLAAIRASSLDKGLICPAAQGSEAAWAGELDVVAAPDLLALLAHLKGTALVSAPPSPDIEPPDGGPDLAQVKGQEVAKRALEIAAAGGHNLLMSGPPGSGKSLLAACLPGILPPLQPSEALEVSMVASVAGELNGGKIRRRRPFRAPHHSASMPALVGGGLRVRPGEISLAHLGVLFLDELPEFQRPVLDSLRQPLETGNVSVARANTHVTFPARVQLVAAMNPCRCGHLGDPALACSRAPRCAADYQARVSGPLLDRIDLHVEVPGVSAADLTLPPPAEGSAEVARRVAAARQIQSERYNGHGPRTNAEADGDLLDQFSTRAPSPTSPEPSRSAASTSPRR
jgi:magnesium chelatase family protein